MKRGFILLAVLLLVFFPGYSGCCGDKDKDKGKKTDDRKADDKPGREGGMK